MAKTRKRRRSGACAKALGKCMHGTKGKHGRALKAKRASCARKFLNCQCGGKRRR